MTEMTKAGILIVDDMEENLVLLSRILLNRGYTVKAVDSGKKAIHYAREAHPDLILLDVNMPIMDGFEACTQLKKDVGTRDIPVIFISALTDVENKVQGFQVGGVDYISKPFEIEEVLARVEIHLALQSLREQLTAANRQLAARIDDLTRSQKMLRERESKLRAFVDALPALSFIFDEQGRYLEILTSEADLLIMKADELQGKLINDVLPPHVATLMMDAIQQTIETRGTKVVEYSTPVLAGGERWFEGRSALMEKDEAGHSKVVFIATDISERIRLYQQVRRLADQDALTSCFNRRHFMSLAETEMQRTARYQRPMSFLMLDIDHFKKFNDNYGHQIGDQLLCALVDLCQKQLRSIDIMGRYGGEEFVILMTETDKDGGQKAAERLRKKIESLKIRTSKGKLSVTVSMGITNMVPDSDQSQTLDMIIKRADQALYTAKDAGRNCVRMG